MFQRLIKFENSKEWWYKAFSMVGSIISLYFAGRWVCQSWNDSKTLWEPLITTIGILCAVIFQALNWGTYKEWIFWLESRNNSGRDDLVYDRVLNLSAYDYEIAVSPEATSYWRWGLKFGNDFNIPIIGRIVTGFPLFHLIDSNDEFLSVIYFDENETEWNKGVNVISDNYDGESIVLQISSNINQINISILKDGKQVFVHNINAKYFFAKIMTWADNEPYKIKTTVREYKQKK